MTATALDQADRRPHRRSPRVGPGCHLVANSWPASEPRGACWREAERRRVRGSPAGPTRGRPSSGVMSPSAEKGR